MQSRQILPLKQFPTGSVPAVHACTHTSWCFTSARLMQQIDADMRGAHFCSCMNGSARATCCERCRGCLGCERCCSSTPVTVHRNLHAAGPCMEQRGQTCSFGKRFGAGRIAEQTFLAHAHWRVAQVCNAPAAQAPCLARLRCYGGEASCSCWMRTAGKGAGSLADAFLVRSSQRFLTLQ